MTMPTQPKRAPTTTAFMPNLKASGEKIPEIFTIENAAVVNATNPESARDKGENEYFEGRTSTYPERMNRTALASKGNTEPSWGFSVMKTIEAMNTTRGINMALKSVRAVEQTKQPDM